MVVQNKKSGMSSLYLAKLVNAQHKKIKNFCSSSLWTWLNHMVILRSQNNISSFCDDFSLGVDLKITFKVVVITCSVAKITL